MIRYKRIRGKYGLLHNPGYDFLRLLNWMKEADPQNPELTFGPYLIPSVAILSACCAIEGYVNMVGQKIDPKWNEFDKGPVPIKDRILRIYSHVNKTPDFSKGVWQQALGLFKIRNELVHPRYVETEEERGDEIPDLFLDVNRKYPPAKVQIITEATINQLLSDTDLSDMRHKYLFRTYSGPPRKRLS